MIAFIIFISRNIVRIEKEVVQYKYEILNKPYYYLDQSHFRIQKSLNKLISNYQNCEIDVSNCITKKGSTRIIKKYGKYVITRKNVK